MSCSVPSVSPVIVPFILNNTGKRPSRDNTQYLNTPIEFFRFRSKKRDYKGEYHYVEFSEFHIEGVMEMFRYNGGDIKYQDIIFEFQFREFR